MMMPARRSSSMLSTNDCQDEGWQAVLKLRLQKIDGRTCLLPLQRIGPLTVQRPFYPEGEVCHVYVLHPPGGVVGGDQLKLDIDVRPGAQGLITTPGAGKFYRSAGKTAGLQQKFNVYGNAALEFLPLENIYFPAAEVSSKILVNLDKDAKFVGWEIHCFGLPANGEDFTAGKVLLNTELKVDGKLLLHDRLKIDFLEQARLCGLQGSRVYGSFVIYSQAINKSLLELLQSQKAESGIAGVSRVESELIVVRYLGNSTEHALNYFRKLWAISRPRALGLEACKPRIWDT
ncbi:MAG TPA: urease accessory protein UreD [Gammaproteobacteria bacterium]|nr:urease accessory protein UreD [Gammaproteobacteria bacterium]